MAANSNPDFKKIIKWFIQTDHEQLSQNPSPEALNLNERFKIMYANSNRTNHPKQKILLKKYQADWDKVFLRNETCLPPIPETYIAKLYICAMDDLLLEKKVDSYGFRYLGSKYFKRTIIEMHRLIKKDEDPKKSIIIFLNFCRDQIDKEYAGVIFETLAFDTDMKILSSLILRKEPKSFEALVALLQDQALFSEDVKLLSYTHTSCVNLINAILYFKWSDDEKKAFEEFFEDPMNSDILEKWKQKSANKNGESIPVVLHTAIPNNVSKKTLGEFFGYFGTSRFDENYRVILKIHAFYEELEDLCFLLNYFWFDGHSIH